MSGKDMRAFYAVLGMGERPKNVCAKEVCTYCREDRRDSKNCTEGHPTGNYESCEWHSDPKLREKPTPNLS